MCRKPVPLDGDLFHRMHLAHIQSRGAGGSDTAENTLCKCFHCHIEVEHTKGDKLSKISVFAMNDCDWMAGEDAQSVRDEYNENYGGDDGECIEEPLVAMTDEELEATPFRDDDGNGNPVKTTFKAVIDKLIADGQKFPCFFASTEC